MGVIAYLPAERHIKGMGNRYDEALSEWSDIVAALNALAIEQENLETALAISNLTLAREMEESDSHTDSWD